VEGSRAYRPLDKYLMPTGTFTEKKDTDRLNLGVPGDAPAWLDSMRRTLDFQLKQLAYRARAGKLEGVRPVGGALVVSPLESEVPDAAEALKWELNSFMPNVHITDLLAEVDGWTGFADKFTHLRTGDMVRNRSAILAAVLADATNLGPSAWRKPHPMSANDRLVGRVCFTSGQRLTGRRKQRSSTRIQPIRTPLFGAPARRRLPTGSSSAPATAPPPEAT
jgi:hypothetical protein